MALIRSSKLLNLAGNGSWYSIRNAQDGPTQVSIYDEIGFVGVTANQFLDDISGLDQFELHLNTPGGEVFDGIAIYEALKSKGNVHIVVDSLAASIGSVIAMAGAPLTMAKNAQLMIHDGFSLVAGNAADMRKMADTLDKASDNIASIYAERTGGTVDHWRGLMRDETWFNADEAVQAGLANAVKGKATTWNLADFGYQPRIDLASVDGQPILNAEKYSQADRDSMAKSGEAMEDGSYPIRDAEDLGNAIEAVGEGNAPHDTIRRHIIKRAHALGLSSRIPESWSADGSNDQASNSWSGLATALRNAL